MTEDSAVQADARNASETGANARGPGRSKDEIALELMKFIVVTTGYGRGSGSGAAGFSGKPTNKSAEEHADALLQLFDRCRVVVGKDPEK
jgi:hypothetical protein